MAKKPQTKKQKDFFKFLAKGENPYHSAILAGYSPKSAGNSAKINTVNYKNQWDKILAKKGLDDEKIANKLVEGMEAQRVISANIVMTKSDDPTVKEQLAHSRTKDFIEVPDYYAQHKFLDTALKLKNAYPAEKREISGRDGEPVSFYLPQLVGGCKDKEEEESKE